MTILVHCQNEQGEDAKTASRLLHLLRAGQNERDAFSWVWITVKCRSFNDLQFR